MQLFISAGEPSGDLHGSNLVRALRQKAPDVECVGFGGASMEAAGCKLLYPLCSLAVMGVVRVLTHALTFIRLILLANRFFRDERPGAVVLIDYPGLHWWLARRARAYGIPVYYFVPPQIWAWASWRAGKLRRYVNETLCNLPFEEEWYRERGVPVRYVGHPYFDALGRQVLDTEFVEAQRRRGGRVVALLPGSRNQEIKHNLSTLIRAAMKIRASRPDARFLAACYREAHRQTILDYMRKKGINYIEPHVGRTPEIIHLAETCISVSGSVGLELLFHARPAVVIYRINPFVLFLVRRFKRSRYISLVNLLAGREIYPEFLSSRCEAEAVSSHVLGWLDGPVAAQKLREELTELRDRVALPGACARAADHILDGIGSRASPEAA